MKPSEEKKKTMIPAPPKKKKGEKEKDPYCETRWTQTSK